MRPFTHTMPFPEALSLALQATIPISRTEHVALGAADGRVVSHDVVSPLDVPPFDRSAMDGYAVQSADLRSASAAAPVALTCVARIFTGEVSIGELRSGECIQIATGAPMPNGADAVVMVEETSTAGAGVPEPAGGLAEAARVFFSVAAKAGQNIGRRAADIAVGTSVVTRGQVLTPSRIGALAATGHRTVEVFAKPTVAIVSTGNEVVQPGLPLPPGHIYDINRFTLESVARRHGGAPLALASPGDSLDELMRVLDAAMAHDLIVFSGGSSVGDRDLVRDVIAERGEMLFHGIAVKPGKPTAFAVMTSGVVSPSNGQRELPRDTVETPVASSEAKRLPRSLFIGMPGNPTSCLSNAYILMVPVLRKLAGLPPWEPHTVTVPLARRIISASDRHQFYTVRLVNGQAEPAFKGSGDITSMANADGYMEIPATTESIGAGTLVTVTLF